MHHTSQHRRHEHRQWAHLYLWVMNNAIIIFLLLLIAFPGATQVTTSNYKYFNYPPYIPPFLKGIGRLSQPSEWTATDIPWALAWYSDRPALWIPDTLEEFNKKVRALNP